MPVDCEPDVDLEPDQDPEALQLVALVDVQLRVDEPPELMLVGLAVRDTVTGFGVVTFTDTVPVAAPPLPVHVRLYVALADSAPVDCEPDVDLVPDQSPEAVQVVALVEDQLKLDEPPELTFVGLALSETVGGCRVGGLHKVSEPTLTAVPG